MLERDEFVSLPTGCGKYLCCTALLYVFDAQMARDNSDVVVVCSLQGIMKGYGSAN